MNCTQLRVSIIKNILLSLNIQKRIELIVLPEVLTVDLELYDRIDVEGDNFEAQAAEFGLVELGLDGVSPRNGVGVVHAEELQDVCRDEATDDDDWKSVDLDDQAF